MIRAFVVLLAALLAGVGFVDSVAAFVPEEFQPNYDEGYGVGYPKGYASGFHSGRERGRTEGWENGTNEGKSDGWNDAFQPAYDLAYDARFPMGHRAGWKEGLYNGFDEGFDYAPVIAKQVYEYYGITVSSGVTMTMVGSDWSGGSFGGVLNINLSGGWGSSLDIYTSFVDPIPVDYAKIYYDEGYTVGQAAGYSTGSQEGYDLAYPKAYGAAYPLAYRLGVWDGTREGTKQGRREGYDDGFDVGYDSGYDEGFYAGIDYHLFGEFSIARYSLDYTPRSDRFTRQALLAAQAPEPGSVALALVGALAGGVLRCGRPRRSARRG